ncbi:MAG TPA: acyl-CoA dehydrogenase family protein [Solirubrobacterales bacterium]|nr:acyl-CoA dehydrogenase family protein [Solirubrobacterales bacterium]
MAFGLRALTALAGSDVLDKLGLREQAERALGNATKGGFRAAGAAGRTFSRVSRNGKPARQKTGVRSDLFDLTPDDEQAMMREAVGSFAETRFRPAALEADAACEAPADLMSQANELGITMLGVPEELGGALSERSAVTSALVTEKLAQGDMGLALAALSPSAVATAIGLWGDSSQQATYLPELTGENVPAAALAIQEPRAIFDPFELRTTATRSGDGFVLDGEKSIVARGVESELFVIAADLDDHPALFIVEAATKGVLVEPQPAMGLRPAATANLKLAGVNVGAEALLGDGDPNVYADCVRLGRIAWAALAVGTAQAVCDYVIPYVNERIAFGEPISHRQAVAFKVADMATELEGMRLVMLRAASRVDQGLDFARESALARRMVAQKGMQIGSDGVQLLGGHGYIKEHPVERWYRDLRAAGLMEGSVLV